MLFRSTGYQLDQTLDGVRYAKHLSEQIVKGNVLVNVSAEKLDARNIIDSNKQFIAEEVVAYVSSSWRDFGYNETKCKRDVKYIVDAIRTDLVYGGNQRTNKAGEFYYLYPSNATIGGVPSTTTQLDPTITGVYYINQLARLYGSYIFILILCIINYYTY